MSRSGETCQPRETAVKQLIKAKQPPLAQDTTPKSGTRTSASDSESLSDGSEHGDTTGEDYSSSFSVSNLDEVSDYTASDPEAEGCTYMARRTGRVLFQGTPSEFVAFKTQSREEAARDFLEGVEGENNACALAEETDDGGMEDTSTPPIKLLSALLQPTYPFPLIVQR